ncbi:MAG: accessory factor UbiK family protein [Pseudomonadales bacterium]|nr:accessory factor UbiK family protein [Pseudomonadales bacterium]
MDMRELADNLGEKIEQVLPEGLSSSRQDLHNNINTLIQESFSKLDIVTRAEFDRQADILAATRSRLEQAEKQLSVLEAQLNAENPSS